MAFHMFDISILYERKVLKAFKKKNSSLCFYNTMYFAIFKTQYCIK